MKPFLEETLQSNGWLLYILYCLTLWTWIIFNSEYIATEELYNEYTQQKIEENYTDQYEEIASEFEEDLEDFEYEEESNLVTDNLINLLFIVIQSSIQFFIISIFIYVALTFDQQTEHINFPSIFKSVIVAEFVFFIPRVIKLIWFTIIDDYSYEDLVSFGSLSLYSMLKGNDIPQWLSYPLQLLNVYEIAYIMLLVTCITIVSGLKMNYTSKYVVLAYTSFLSIWICIRIYISTIFQ